MNNILDKLKEWIDIFKQPIPTISLVLGGIFTYNLFLKPMFKLPKIDEHIMTFNLSYFTNKFEIFAKKSLSQGSKRVFYNVDIEDERGHIKAGYADLRNDKDILFKNNLHGSNDDWNFDSDGGRYLDIGKDVIFTLTGSVKATNLKRELKISAENFRMSNNFDNLKLKGDVEIEFKGSKIFCQNASFDQKKDLLLTEGSASIDIVKEIEGKESEIRIESIAIEYKTKSEQIESKEAFTIMYDKYIIKGREFLIKGDNFTTPNPIYVTDRDGTTDLNIEEVQYLSVLRLKNIEGRYDNTEVKADDLEYNEGKGTFSGSVYLERDSLALKCGLLKFDQDTANAFKDVEIKDNEYIFSSKTAKYDRKKDILSSPETVIISLDQNKKITSSSFQYAKETKKGNLTEVNIQKENLLIKADKLILESEDDYVLEGNIEIEKEDTVLNSEYIKVTKDEANIPEMVLKYLDINLKLDLKDVKYDLDNQIIRTEREIKGLKDNYSLSSKGLEYNVKDKNGDVKGDLVVSNTEEKFFLISPKVKIENDVMLFEDISGYKNEAKFSSDRAKSINGNTIKLLDNIKVIKDKVEILSDEIDVNIKENMVLFEKYIYIFNDDLLIISEKGELYLDNNNVLGTNVLLFREKGDIVKSNYAELDSDMQNLSVTGGIVGDLSNRGRFSSDKGILLFTEDTEGDKITRAELVDNVRFRYKNIDIESNFLEYDNALGENKLELIYVKDNLKINFEYVDFSTDLRAKYAFYELKKDVGRMKQDVVITYKHTTHGVVNAASNEAYYDNMGKKVSLLGNVKAKGTKSQLDVTGDDISINLNTGVITGKGESGFSYDFDKKSNGSDGNKLEEEIKNEVLKEFEEDIKEVTRIKDEFIK